MSAPRDGISNSLTDPPNFLGPP